VAERITVILVATAFGSFDEVGQYLKHAPAR